MTDLTPTSFDNICNILGEFWVEYKADPQYQDFMDYSDLGLPLAYALSTNIISSTPLAENFVRETWEIFIDLLGIQDDNFESLSDIMMFTDE